MFEVDGITMNAGSKKKESFETLGMDVKKSKKQKSQIDDFEVQTLTLNAKRTQKSEERKAMLRESYKEVVVNDFGDEYHLSEEEKKERNMYYEAFAQLRRCKRKYRKISDYVKVFRLCLDTLDVVANNNNLYTPEKFKMMVAKGDIQVYGLNFPKYIGKDKRDINWEYISKCISDRSVDLSSLDRKNNNPFDIDFDDEDEVTAMRKRMFGKDYYKIFGDEAEEDFDEEDTAFLVENIFADDSLEEESDDTETNNLVVKELSGKKMKQVISAFPDVQKFVREAKRRRNDQERLSSFVFDVSADDFEYIERLDNKRGFNSSSTPPVFKGDIMNDSDYKKYLYELDQWERSHTMVNHRGRQRTLDEVREIELKEMLERDGWNIRNMYRNKEKEKKIEKQNKRDKKNEKKLKQKLIEIQNRRKNREDKSMVNTKKKKKNKKKGKKDKGV